MKSDASQNHHSDGIPNLYNHPSSFLGPIMSENETALFATIAAGAALLYYARKKRRAATRGAICHLTEAGKPCAALFIWRDGLREQVRRSFQPQLTTIEHCAG